MNDTALYETTVPVLRYYVVRIEAVLSERLTDDDALLRQRLAPNAFTAAEHLATALGFVSRTVFPLTGREIDESGDGIVDRSALLRCASETRALLAGIDAADFDGASDRIVRHTAGSAELAQDATTFVTLFALPNFFFHFGMAFALFRAAGVDIGKADFDGQHAYAPGFHFP